MALKFVEGFGSYTNASQIERKWDSGLSALAANDSLETGRVPALGYSLGFAGDALITRNLGNHATWVVGFAFNNVNVNPPSQPMPILCFMDSVYTQVHVAYNSQSRLLSVYREGTQLGVGTTQLDSNTWYYIEAKATINNSTGAVTVKVNEATDITVTGANTRVTANNYANRIGFRSTVARGRYKLDDIYVFDGSGSTNNDFVGDMKVETIRTTGAGNSTNWTVSGGSYDNWSAVRDGQTSYYLSTTGTDVQDLYTFNDLTKVTTSIKGVVVNYTARNSDSDTHDLKSATRVSSTDYTDSTATTIDGATWKTYYSVWEQNPNTTAAWTSSGINGAEFGIKLIS